MHMLGFVDLVLPYITVIMNGFWTMNMLLVKSYFMFICNYKRYFLLESSLEAA